MLTFPCVMLNWVRTAYLFAGESNSGYVFQLNSGKLVSLLPISGRASLIPTYLMNLDAWKVILEDADFPLKHFTRSHFQLFFFLIYVSLLPSLSPPMNFVRIA